MQALKVLVVAMAVLIIAGVVVLAVTIAGRLARPPDLAIGPVGAVGASVLLDEPAGTRVSGSAVAAGTLALTLSGGGPGRVVVLDLSSGRVLRRIALAR